MQPDIDIESSGTPVADISYRIDVSSVIDAKRAAMVTHRSQIGQDNILLSMPEDLFATAFGSEWFNIPGQTQANGPTDTISFQD